MSPLKTTLLLPVLVPILALSAPAATAVGAQGPGDPPQAGEGAVPEPLPLATTRLRAWHDRFADAGEFWRGARGELEVLLGETAEQARLGRPDLYAAGLVLLDLAGLGTQRLPLRADFSGGGDRQRTRRLALGALNQLLESPLGRRLMSWMANEVLASGLQHPLARRLMVLYVVAERRPERGRMALLSIGRDERDPLRPEVLELLATWPDEAVDLFLVGLIGRKYDRSERPHPFNLLLRRVREGEAPLGERAAAVLEQRLAVMLMARDWRDASRAIELARGLQPERRVPLLLDALSAWHRRDALGRGSRRILDDIVRELQQISGRTIGTNPKNWITWWIAVRQGKTQLGVDLPRDDAPRTSAQFFGLRPVTDKVTFVIDYSGSMADEWGTQEHSRFVEAVEQMMRFLQASGEDTRFNVVLFASEPDRSSPHLVRATTRNIMRARRSMLTREPDGGTRLRPAIELALRMDRKGEVDPARLEADTIVVLCDGETEEGRGWVQPMLARIQADARIKFHCVLVGSKGDGTLEALAEGTGGDFIRIGG